MTQADDTRDNAQQEDYEVVLARSGATLRVAAGASLLDALLDAGADLDYGCGDGICGMCETRVLEGVPEHRDIVLTDAERASNTRIMPCVSGCRSGRLVLDL